MNIRKGIRISKILLIANLLTQSTVQAQDLHRKTAPKATAKEASLPFAEIPVLREAFINASPTDNGDGIPVGKLGIDGGNKAMIIEMAQDIAGGKYGNFDSYLISHKGKLIFESYYRKGRIDLPHPQASATKAYTSMALGRAIGMGYLTMADLDKPLISFLKDLKPAKLVEGAERVTLRKALTMRSGIRISREQRDEFEKKPRKLKGQGHVQTYLENSAPITAASQSFKYQYDPMLVMQVIEAVVPGSAEDFIKKELLDKLGITNYSWGTELSGLPKAGSYSSMTSRDMIKWGTLAIDKGKWNGEQLVPQAFMATATSKIVDQRAEYDNPDMGVTGTAYGYLWWQADLSAGGKTYLSKSARGGSGQNIIVIEELDLVIVTTTHRDVDDVTAVTATRALPAFVQGNTASPGSNSGQDVPSSTADRYLGQKRPGLTAEPFAPGMISTKGWVLGGDFGPNSKEFYMVNPHQGGYAPKVVVFRKEGRTWTQHDFMQTHTTDSNRLYRRNQYIERTATGWSEMKSLGPMFEREDWGIMRVTASKKGTYVFDDYKSNDIIRISRIKDGKRETPQLLGKEINVGKWTAHPNIAPDESYLIWDSEREEGYGDSDIYVTFKQPDGSWGKAINLGDKVNSEHADFSSWISSDGKYLFFWRSVKKTRADGSTYNESGRYWVSTQVIENLRPGSKL